MLDAESTAEHANNAAIVKWMRPGFPHPYTVDERRKWLESVVSSSPTYDFAICPVDKLDHSDYDSIPAIGGIGVKPRSNVEHRTMGVGYWLGESYWGRGIATAAVKGFSAWAFEAFPHLLRLEAEVFAHNVASARVLTKAGYTLEGRKRQAIEKDGVVMDLLVFGLLRDE